MTEELTKSINWRGTYRGVRYEIKHHGVSACSPHGIWCYYIKLYSQQLSEKDFSKIWLDPVRYEWDSTDRIRYNYEESVLSSVKFHGGITFYEKKQDPDDHSVRYIKVGCDYAHLWDEGKRHWYDEGYVLRGVKNTIDKLHDLLRIKQRCRIVGGWFYPEDGIKNPKNEEELISKRGLAYLEKGKAE